MESEVRSYCRKFPVEFSKARNSELFTKDGTRYIDFFNMAGSLNYGHNNPYIKRAIMDYLSEDTIINSSFASYESNVRMRPERQTELAKLE